MAIPTLVATLVGYLIKTLKDPEVLGQAINDLADDAWHWMRPIFLKDDHPLKELKNDPDHVGNQELIKAQIKKHLENNPDEIPALKVIVDKIKTEQTREASAPQAEDDGLESFPARGIEESGPPTSDNGLDPFGAEKTEQSQSFEAFPFISDPGNVESGAAFTVEVGFSQELDRTLREVSHISIANPDPGDFLEVSLSAVGADVSNKPLKRLPLDVDASVKFHCTAYPGEQKIHLKATYFYKRQPVGTATRLVRDTAPAAGRQRITLDAPQPDEMIDLTVTITWDEGKKLNWKLVGADLDADATTQISNSREFAASLVNKLDPNVNSGAAASNTLETLGQKIAACMPPEFFKAVSDIHQKTGRIPRILLWTNEPCIPWELACHQGLRLDRNFKPFLHLQTYIGRWGGANSGLTSPPTALPIQRLSVVATDYSVPDSFSSAGELPEAEHEKTFLIDRFKARDVPADFDTILALTGETPQAGHLLHIALHGISNAEMNEHVIILKDEKQLSADQMIGAYYAGDTPVISFMFLNACQVGTAGETLGQASGFPGVLLMKGLLGFIAPLWSIDDVQARHFCENFYTKTLSENRPVGEVLLELRRGVNFKESLTELAYIYYGHPALKLTKSYS